MTRSGLLRALACALGMCGAACTIITNLDGFTCDSDCADATTTTTDSTSQADSTTTNGDSALNSDAAVDTGVNRADASVDADANRDADAADALTYTCPGSGTVSDCAGCAAGPFPCVLCANNGANKSKMVGVCVTSPSSGSACQGKGPSGYDDCLCTSETDPSPCVEDYQICLAPFGPACRTCGYDGGVGLKCKGGGNCSASGLCQ